MREASAGWLKLNVDAAIDVANECMGFGWILRDDMGCFKAAVSKAWKGAYSAREADAVVIREALCWLKVQNLDRIHIETDALLVVQGLKSVEGVLSFELILLDIKDMVSQFTHTYISFVKRSTNQTAHVLAWESVSIYDRL